MDGGEKLIAIITLIIMTIILGGISVGTYSGIKYREYQIECVKNGGKMINEILPGESVATLYCTTK